jgi:hypothetical protein
VKKKFLSNLVKSTNGDVDPARRHIFQDST